MRLSRTGLNFIKSFEKFKPVAYPDSDGKWTIGYGHSGGMAVKGAMVNKAQAIALLSADVSIAETAVRKGVKGELTQNRFDALVSFAYNIGATRFADSDLVKLINKGAWEEAGDEMMRYVYARKVRQRGLEVRRAAERKMFDSGQAAVKADGC